MSRTPLTYADRLAALRERKLAQTREKIAARGPMDEDDYGCVLPPPGFAWKPVANHPNGCFYGPAGWAENFGRLMGVHPTYVDPHDALAGRWMVFMARERIRMNLDSALRWHPDYPYDHLKPDQERYAIDPGIGVEQHFAPDYRIGLALGWGGLLRKVRECRRRHGPDKAEFFQAEEDVVRAVQGWIARHVDAIRAAEAGEARPELRENLREMAEVNARLVDGPPRTLREACQWIAWWNMAGRVYNRDGAGCQLDEILRPYCERDLAAGRIDDETAVFYLACLLLNDAHYYQIGGPAPDGRDLASRLSCLILEAAHRIGVSCNLTVRVHDAMDRGLFLKGVEYLVRDRQGWPRFSGDRALVEGFMRSGYTAALARERIAVGCNWMALPGREYTMNDTVKINVAKVFEVAFQEMMAEAPEAASAGALFGRFARHLERAVRCVGQGHDWQTRYQQHNAPELMLNLLCHGPIEKGLDAAGGGVEFYNMAVDGTGLATVADSLAALEQRVEREGALTWARIARHLAENWAGDEGERARLLMRASDRYGRGRSLGDAWARRVSETFTRLVTARPTPDGHRMIPGWFSWAATIGQGKRVGATPNGRRAGEPISHGANPDPGFRRDAAPTAMAVAIAAVQPGCGNTAPMQLELDPGVAADDGAVEKIAALLEGHFALGGTLVNINVVDAETLRAAHKDPAKYPDLLVRVTGFTAYFAALSPEFRQLVIDRLIAL